MSTNAFCLFFFRFYSFFSRRRTIKLFEEFYDHTNNEEHDIKAVKFVQRQSH